MSKEQTRFKHHYLTFLIGEVSHADLEGDVYSSVELNAFNPVGESDKNINAHCYYVRVSVLVAAAHRGKHAKLPHKVGICLDLDMWMLTDY